MHYKTVFERLVSKLVFNHLPVQLGNIAGYFTINQLAHIHENNIHGKALDDGLEGRTVVSISARRLITFGTKQRLTIKIVFHRYH